MWPQRRVALALCVGIGVSTLDLQDRRSSDRLNSSMTSTEEVIDPPVDPKYQYELGELSVEAKDIRIGLMKFDRIAFLHDQLLYLSVFAEKGRIKQLRALLQPGTVKNLSISGSGPICTRATDVKAGRTWHGQRPNRIMPTKEGYVIKKKEWDFNMAHAYFIAKDPGFMMVTSPLALFKQIKRSTIKNPITTPFIPEWLEYIDGKLRGEQYLEDCWCYRCACSVFSAGTLTLEKYIKAGLENREINIPPPPPKPEKMPVALGYSIVPNPTV